MVEAAPTKFEKEGSKFGAAEMIYDPKLSPFHAKAEALLKSVFFELALGCVVLFNICIVVLEVDAKAADEALPNWVTSMNRVLLAVYTVEILFRLCVLRLALFKDYFSLLDITLVSIDWVSLAPGVNFGNASILRIVRLAKVARTFKLLKIVPELHLMMKGLVGAAKCILWGTILAGFMILVWAILAVAIIHPINQEIALTTDIYDGCQRCPHAYESVFQASLTFTQQIICGDAWGQVTVPIINRAPYTGLFFYGVFASIALATMNLILAMIVDSAQQARVKSSHDMAREREVAFEKARERLSELCSVLDSDENGFLSLDELMQGFDKNQEFADILSVMDIKQEDMAGVFGIMDHDNSGEVSYDEFTKELWKMQSNDLQSMVITIRFYVTQIRKQLMDQLEVITSKILKKIDQEEEALQKQMSQEEQMLERINNQEQTMLKKEDELMAAMTNEAPSPIKQGSNGAEIAGQVDLFPQSAGSSDAQLKGLMDKLESMESTYGQALANLSTCIQDLTSQVLPAELDKTWQFAAFDRPLSSPGPAVSESVPLPASSRQASQWLCSMNRCRSERAGGPSIPPSIPHGGQQRFS